MMLGPDAPRIPTHGNRNFGPFDFPSISLIGESAGRDVLTHPTKARMPSKVLIAHPKPTCTGFEYLRFEDFPMGDVFEFLLGH